MRAFTFGFDAQIHMRNFQHLFLKNRQKNNKIFYFHARKLKISCYYSYREVTSVAHNQL